MEGRREDEWGKGFPSPGCGGELDEPWLYPTGIKGSTVIPKHRHLLSSLLLFSPPPSPIVLASLLLIWSGIHSLLFAILMKIRHLPCQPSPLSADPCHNNKERKTEKKRGREKSEWGEESGREPLSEKGYYVTAGLVDWIVRWPSEGRKKCSLSFWVATTEVFSHSERVTI